MVVRKLVVPVIEACFEQIEALLAATAGFDLRAREEKIRAGVSPRSRPHHAADRESNECVRKSGVGGVGVAWAHASDNTLQTPDFTSCSAQR